MKEIQSNINKVFKKNFGYTPFGERMKDIQNEFFELMKWNDISNLKEELGDMMCSCMQLATECGWSVDDLINDTLVKIDKRYAQYKSLGRKYKIAILGGAFDPITKGHIEAAKFVLNSSGEFDEVWIMPAYKHMYNKEMLSSDHRIQMAKLAASIDKRIQIWDYEIKNELAGETFYLFKKLKEEKELTEKFNFSMVIGLDNANTFDKWINYEELEKLTRFVVVPRKGVTPDPKVNWFLKQPHILLSNENDIPEISSTQIRKLLKQFYEFKAIDNSEVLIDTKTIRKELLTYMDENVFNYIITNELYK